MPPHAMPPALPGTTSVPFSDGGVKNPSARSALIVARHQLRSSSFVPQASPGFNAVGASARGAVGNGCVGDAISPGTSLFGTARSSTGMSGAPVSRFRMKRWPVFDATPTAATVRPSLRHSKRIGGDATS